MKKWIQDSYFVDVLKKAAKAAFFCPNSGFKIFCYKLDLKSEVLSVTIIDFYFMYFLHV